MSPWGAPAADPVQQRIDAAVETRVREMLRDDVRSLLAPRSVLATAVKPEGAAGSVLTHDGRTAAWAHPGVDDKYGAMYLGTPQGFSLNTWSLVGAGGQWATQAVTDATVVSPTPGSAVINAVKAGNYRVGGSIAFVNPGTTIWIGVRLYLNTGVRVKEASMYWENSVAGLVPSLSIDPVSVGMVAGGWVAMEVYAHITGAAASTWTVSGGLTGLGTHLWMEAME